MGCNRSGGRDLRGARTGLESRQCPVRPPGLLCRPQREGTTINDDERHGEVGLVVGGVDTHKDVHVGAALDQLGRTLGTREFAATPAGYRQLGAWLSSFGPGRGGRRGGHGLLWRGLDASPGGQGVAVLEVNRPNRQFRRRHGKSDVTDAIAAAKAVLAGDACGAPKSGDGVVEAIRLFKWHVGGRSSRPDCESDPQRACRQPRRATDPTARALDSEAGCVVWAATAGDVDRDARGHAASVGEHHASLGGNRRRDPRPRPPASPARERSRTKVVRAQRCGTRHRRRIARRRGRQPRTHDLRRRVRCAVRHWCGASRRRPRTPAPLRGAHRAPSRALQSTEALTIPEVVVERRHGEAGGRRDVGEGDAVDAAFGDRLPRDVEDSLPCRRVARCRPAHAHHHGVRAGTSTSPASRSVIDCLPAPPLSWSETEEFVDSRPRAAPRGGNVRRSRQS